MRYLTRHLASLALIFALPTASYAAKPNINRALDQLGARVALHKCIARVATHASKSEHLAQCVAAFIRTNKIETVGQLQQALAGTKISVKLPKASTPARQAHVTLTATSKRLTVDGKRVTWRKLKASLARAAKAKSTVRIILVVDKSLPYKRVVQIMDAARASGLTKISLATSR